MSVELADIIKDNLVEIEATYDQKRIISKILNCRTAGMGTHKLECDNPDCDHDEYSYNSCRDRHCPRCQGSNQIIWKSNRIDELPLVNYLHIVFAITNNLKFLFKTFNEQCYKLFCKSVKDTLFEYSTGENKLKGKIGFILDLETWNHNLDYYPHIHCLIPEGYINKDNNKWVTPKSKTLFNKKKLQTSFKINLLKNIRELINQESLAIDINSFNNITPKVYIGKKSEDPATVVNYLGNHVNKLVITNDRIISYDNKIVTYSYIDRADGNKIKEGKLSGKEFIEKFLVHTMPPKFMRIRYYGFLANSCRKKYIELFKNILKDIDDKSYSLNSKIRNTIKELMEIIEKGYECPLCHNGKLIYASPKPTG